jgi:16S rRNA (adenine1518-N6/adenine1519-N6)-dimethyltransferase
MGRRLGQHFLKDRNVLKKITEALEIQSGDFVIEIGSGQGSLTELLMKAPINKIIAIEKDKKLALDLKLKNRDGTILEVIEGDALKILPTVTNKLNREYKLIGNIPYYITGYLLRVIAELENKPSLIVFTIQKEVAERLTAQPPAMNLLAASVQYWAEPKIITSIPAGSFSPPPKVDSAIISLKTKKVKDSESYYKFIKILFKQPRKTILNNLAESLELNKDEIGKKLSSLDIKERSRPQNLDLKTIQKMSKIF